MSAIPQLKKIKIKVNMFKPELLILLPTLVLLQSILSWLVATPFFLLLKQKPCSNLWFLKFFHNSL